ncbi:MULTISPECIES: hypothetical protein [unclassified Sphingomonas]|nr:MULTISPECIES: hypothetical protein [unclassified Sphingomonas]MCR5870981.1 hypothetical protein [Sphingomonas sp. J344]UUY00697.1 hypothetical protein LRS08_06365 [Sphingomonas sp. J315]
MIKYRSTDAMIPLSGAELALLMYPVGRRAYTGAGLIAGVSMDVLVSA